MLYRQVDGVWRGLLRVVGNMGGKERGQGMHWSSKAVKVVLEPVEGRNKHTTRLQHFKKEKVHCTVMILVGFWNQDTGSFESGGWRIQWIWHCKLVLRYTILPSSRCLCDPCLARQIKLKNFLRTVCLVKASSPTMILATNDVSLKYSAMYNAQMFLAHCHIHAILELQPRLHSKFLFPLWGYYY